MLIDTTIHITANATELAAILTVLTGAGMACRKLPGALNLRRLTMPRIMLQRPTIARCKQLLLLGQRKD